MSSESDLYPERHVLILEGRDVIRDNNEKVTVQIWSRNQPKLRNSLGNLVCAEFTIQFPWIETGNVNIHLDTKPSLVFLEGYQKKLPHVPHQEKTAMKGIDQFFKRSMWIDRFYSRWSK